MGLFTPPPNCVDKFPEGQISRECTVNTKYQYGAEYICLACATKNGGVYDAAGNSQWEDAGAPEIVGHDVFTGDTIECAWCKTREGKVIHPRYFGEDMPYPPDPVHDDVYEPTSTSIFGELSDPEPEPAASVAESGASIF